MKKDRKQYEAPLLIMVGQITSLTGMCRCGEYLDSSMGMDSWKMMGTEIELEEL